MSRFTQLKVNGVRTRVDLSKVTYFSELKNGNTDLTFDNGSTLIVDESYQTVSNRANAVESASE